MSEETRNSVAGAEFAPSLAEALDHGAVVVARPDWGTLHVTGPDRSTWLNGIVTCNVAEVTPERGAWGLLLSKQGKIEAELQILASRDALFVGVSGGDPSDLHETLDRYLVMEDVDLEQAGGFTWWELHGPRALAAARSCAEHLAALGAMSWTARGGAALVAPSASASAVHACLSSAGAVVASPEQWEPARLRLGLPRYGVDFGPEDNPHAAAIERRAVSWTKGCYLGQEVVCMQDMRGKVKRRLVRLELPADDRSTGAGTAVLTFPEAADVGQVKSRAGRFAIASVRAPADQPGGEVRVGEGTARVLELALQAANDGAAAGAPGQNS